MNAIVRGAESLGGVLTHVYYLRSSVLGKIIAELDQTGYKRLGYVFAGGMQIANQSVWNPGYGYDVALTTTSPATGSEYVVGGPYLSRKELDPFGTDVTEPPAPMLISEPVFYNPKFADMLLEIEGGPSDEYEQNNADWASLVTATIQAAQQRDRAERLWQSGRRSEAMAILQRNPNVGIEYRGLVNREVTMSGSYFGKDAADFLNGLNMALEAGLIVGVTEEGSVKRQHAEWKTPRELYGSGMDRTRAYNFMRGYNVALKVLDNADCVREVSILGGDLYYGAKRTLAMIFTNGGFRFDPTLTSLARVQGRGAAARILLSESFMQGNLRSANRDLEHLLYGETLALAILHELVHALGGRQHGDFGTPEGKKEHDRWNDVIYDNCFKKP